jgi:hypothetical protein
MREDLLVNKMVCEVLVKMIMLVLRLWCEYLWVR